MIRKLFTLLLVFIPIVLMTSCQRQLPTSTVQETGAPSSQTQKTEAPAEPKEHPKLDEKDIYNGAEGINKNKDATIIQSDENRITEQQDNNKKFFTLKDRVIADGRVISAQRNILLFDDGCLYYAKLSKETKEPVLCLIAEHVKQMGTQPGINENTSPEFQTDDGRFWRYSGDGTDLEPELLTDEDTFKDYTIKGQNMVEDTRQGTSTAPWSRLFSFFQTGRYQSETFGYQLKDATESNYHDEEIYYFYLNQQGELDYRKIDEHSPKVFLPVVKHQDYTIEKFQANYFNPDTNALQVCYLSNNSLYIIDDFCKTNKEQSYFSNVRDFWRGSKNTIIFQKKNGSVFMYRPNKNTNEFLNTEKILNIDPGMQIKDFVYFPSENGLEDYKYTYTDMDGKLHYGSNIHLLNSPWENAETMQPQDQNFSNKEFKEAQKQAEYLSYDLIDSFTAYNKKTKRNRIFEPMEIENFIYSAAVSDLRHNTEYMYYNFFTVNEDNEHIFSLKQVRQIVYEVFGLDDWSMNYIEYNPHKQQYHSRLEFGFGSNGSAKNLTTRINKDTATIQTEFLYTDSILFEGEPGWHERGNYTMTFKMMRENNRMYLRFVELKPQE